MSGNISEQELTNYALNDGLEPHERLYVESFLGTSEERRGDVCKMIELAQMLEAGFEMEADQAAIVPTLTAEQRAKLLAVPARSTITVGDFLRKSAAAVAMAACVALALANLRLWQPESRNQAMAAVQSIVDEISPSDQDTDITTWVNPPVVSEDDANSYIKASTDGMPQDEETICTPPTRQEQAEMH